MDWNAAIERNREALTRILAALIAMAELAATGLSFSPCGRRCRGEAETDEGYLYGRATLPRHLHRAVLRLLRPAESAARRLVIVAARGLVMPPPWQRPRKPKPKPTILRNGPGTGIGAGILMPPLPQASLAPTAPRALALPLLDPQRRLPRRARPAASGVPRISIPGATAPFPVPVRRPLSPYDPIDATRLSLRLAALSRALDDLPSQARRFARWRCRAAAGAQNRKSPHAGRIRRVWPLRAGRPPGQRPAKSRRPAHEVHDVLNDAHGLAFWALERPDTS